jgi:hypothetical protein
MITRPITYLYQEVTLACDARCTKAWGINNRPRVRLSEDPDDYAFLSDDELDVAPEDPGTYEGRDAKPQIPSERLNKWCARECERSIMLEPLEEGALPDFSKRVRNKWWARP